MRKAQLEERSMCRFRSQTVRVCIIALFTIQILPICVDQLSVRQLLLFKMSGESRADVTFYLCTIRLMDYKMYVCSFY